MPVVVVFIVVQDGSLPGGETVQEFIEKIDAATNSYASFYAINCAYPTVIKKAVKEAFGTR